MANLEKHKKNLNLGWLEGEDNLVPTHSRSSKVLGSYLKIPKPPERKPRPNPAVRAEVKPEPPMMREPSLPLKAEEKHSQASSWEHLKRVDRLSKLRAPYPKRRGAAPRV